MINKNNKEKDYLKMLSKCVLIRHFIKDNKERKILTYKYKEFNDAKEIVNQGMVDVNIDDIDNMKLLLKQLEFEELIRIKDNLYIYASDTDELAIQFVNDKHLYIEIEDCCNRINKIYNSIDEMKDVIKKCSIPIKNENYFVKKVEIELQEKYGNILY